MSELATSYILYLAAYRVTSLLVGAFTVYLGYRLFVRGVWPDSHGAEITAAMAGQRFTIKNAAPGTVIALFGVAIITAMVVGAPPQGTFEEMVGLGASEAGRARPLATSAAAATRMTLRGTTDTGPAPLRPTIGALNARGVEAEAAGEPGVAADFYQQAVDTVAAPLNNLAWLRFQDGEAESALPLASLAVQLSPRSAAFLHTLAEIERRLGHSEQARAAIEKAAALDPDSYGDLLEDFGASR